VLDPTRILNTSPLTTVPNQTDDIDPISTSPIIIEFGAIKQSEFILGILFLKGSKDISKVHFQLDINYDIMTVDRYPV
jgi:hypothetical protein